VSAAHIQAGRMDSHFSERVRNLFNDRADSWGSNYLPSGKLRWRLDEFCAVLDEFAASSAEVLDFGCGTGHLADHLSRRGYVLTACDMADRMIATARRNFGETAIRWANLPAYWRRLPFGDGSFDAIVASSVFEYVDDLEHVFSELARVLRPGGLLIFNVPDPRNLRRKREAWSNRLLRPLWIRHAASTIPRVHRYLVYLGLSKNRLPLAEWQSGARRHGFQRLPTVLDLSESHPLFLFVFQKALDRNRQVLTRERMARSREHILA
jgi:SAM-dependent methyltransferase